MSNSSTMTNDKWRSYPVKTRHCIQKKHRTWKSDTEAPVESMLVYEADIGSFHYTKHIYIVPYPASTDYNYHQNAVIKKK